MWTLVVITLAALAALAIVVHAAIKARQDVDTVAADLERAALAREFADGVTTRTTRRRHLERLHEESPSPSGEFVVTWPKQYNHQENDTVTLSLRRGNDLVWQDTVSHPGHAVVNDEGACMVVKHPEDAFRSGVRLYNPHGDLLMEVDFPTGIPEFGFTANQRYVWCVISQASGKSMTRGRIMLFSMPDCDRIVAFPDIRNTNPDFRGAIQDIQLSEFHARLIIEGEREVTCDLHGNIVGGGSP